MISYNNYLTDKSKIKIYKVNLKFKYTKPSRICHKFHKRRDQALAALSAYHHFHQYRQQGVHAMSEIMDSVDDLQYKKCWTGRWNALSPSSPINNQDLRQIAPYDWRPYYECILRIGIFVICLWHNASRLSRTAAQVHYTYAMLPTLKQPVGERSLFLTLMTGIQM